MNSKITIFITIIYRLLLDYNYVEQISPFFAYANFTYNYNFQNYLLSWLILIVTLPLFTTFLKNLNLSSSQGGIILYLIRFIPFTSLVAFKDLSITFIEAMFVFWVLLFILLNKFPTINIGFIKVKSNKFILSIFIILSSTVIFISGYYTHFRINLDLLNVYDLRLEARAFNLPLLLQYLWPAASNILPIMMVYFFLKKKTTLFLLIAFIILLNFSINGSKSTLFKMLLCVGLIFINLNNILKWIIYGLPILCGSCILIDYATHSFIVSGFITRRGLFIPTLLDSLYYDYISKTGPVFFDSTTLTKLPFIIGDTYFDYEEMRCNNGLFTDAFTNMGLLGCIIFPLLITILFKLCNPIFKNVNHAISVFSTFLICITLNSSSLTTALLTHGILLLILTCYFMASYNITNHKSNISVSNYNPNKNLTKHIPQSCNL